MALKLPEAFRERMKKDLGEEEFLRYEASLDRQEVKALRINPLKSEGKLPEDLEAILEGPVPWAENAWYYTEAEENVRPGRHVLHDAGLYYIQEPSAMAVAALSGAREGERILDLCAAPGGKSTQLAGLLGGKGILVSNEIHPQRARILSQNIERMGIRNCVVTNEPPEKLSAAFPAFFDRVVVDAPCSGEGMFAKEEQALTMWSEENVTMCAQRQSGILDHAAVMLKDGGTLIYSTCTFSPEENEEVCARFLSSHPEFSMKDLPAFLGDNMERFGFTPGHPSWCRPEAASKDAAAQTSGALRLFPQNLRGLGHFVAVMEKAGKGSPSRSFSGSKGKPDPKVREAVRLFQAFSEETLSEDFVAGGTEDPNGAFVLFGDELYRLPEHLPIRGLKVLRPGLHLGSLKNRRFEPAHALAMALRPKQALKVFDMDSEGSEARAFLRGEALSCDPSLKGWVLVTADHISMGWGKASGGILKNHLPRGLRR